MEQRKKALQKKLDDMDLRIVIAKHKQSLVREEKEKTEQAIKKENHQYAVMAEELEKKLAQVERKREERELVHRAYQKNVSRLKREIAQSELAAKEELVSAIGEDKENRKFGAQLESEQSALNKLNNQNNQRSCKRLAQAPSVGSLKRLSQKAIKRNRSQQHGASR